MLWLQRTEITQPLLSTEHQLSKYGKKQPQEGIGIVGVVLIGGGKATSPSKMGGATSWRREMN